MILVDTSAWIHFFRGREPVASMVEGYLDDNLVALCGPVATEIRRGIKSRHERQLVISQLDGCRLLEQPDNLWEAAGDLGYALARRGKTVKTIDLLIACYANAHAVPILTLDSDFRLIRNAGLEIGIVAI